MERDGDGAALYTLQQLLADPKVGPIKQYGTAESLVSVLDTFGEDDE